MNGLDFDMLFDSLDGNGQAASVVERQYMNGVSDRACREELDLTELMPKRIKAIRVSSFNKTVLSRKVK